jgi:hypothetical protein
MYPKYNIFKQSAADLNKNRLFLTQKILNTTMIYK